MTAFYMARRAATTTNRIFAVRFGIELSIKGNDAVHAAGRNTRSLAYMNQYRRRQITILVLYTLQKRNQTVRRYPAVVVHFIDNSVGGTKIEFNLSSCRHRYNITPQIEFPYSDIPAGRYVVD